METLSPRELEVLELIARGSTNREAAKQLFQATVRRTRVETLRHPGAQYFITQ